MQKEKMANILIRKQIQGWGCSSGSACLPSVCDAPGSIPSNSRKAGEGGVDTAVLMLFKHSEWARDSWQCAGWSHPLPPCVPAPRKASLTLGTAVTSQSAQVTVKHHGCTTGGARATWGRAVTWLPALSGFLGVTSGVWRKLPGLCVLGCYSMAQSWKSGTNF